MRSLAFIFALAIGFTAKADTQHSPDGHVQPQAWFLSTPETKTSVIRFCVQAKDSSEKAEIEKLVAQALEVWDTYYFMTLADAGESANWIGRKSIQMRGRSKVISICKGDEDLTVFYGVEDNRVRAAKSLYDSPLGFAHLESFDEKTGAGRGFIWISYAPEVRMHINHRRALITHEIGHTVGVGHVSGTVMEENLAQTITQAYSVGTPFDPAKRRSAETAEAPYLWINWENDLAGRTELSYGYHRRMVSIAEGSDMQRAVQALTGKTYTGEFEVGFQRLVSWADETDKEWEPKGKGRLAICSKKCATENETYIEFKAEYGKAFWLPLGEEKLFRRIYKGDEQFLFHRAMILPGAFVETKTGRRTEFLVSRNGDEQLELYIVVNGERLRL